MRLTVTPLGAANQSISSVASAVVDYLDGRENQMAGSLLGPQSDVGVSPSRYYADSIEGPGHWRGAGAEFRELAGTVDRDSFQRVLEGRHPLTGERLVTAQGSSQRSHLAVGTATKFDSAGDALYSVADVARLLRMTSGDVEDLIRSGRVAVAPPVGDTGATSSRVDPDDGPLVADREVSRLLDFAATQVDAGAVRAGGRPGQEFSVTQAASVLRVSPRYVRRLCSAGERSSDERPIAHLPSRRDANGDYRIRRHDLADFAESRKPPVARVGFDLTLTMEKSIALVAMLTEGERQDHIVDALTRANDVALGYLDRYASGARRRGETVDTEGLLVASYLHGTSRALDPHPHFHNVIANAVVDDEGGIRTLDARALYQHAPAAAALATATVRWELRDLGLGWWNRPDGVWEIAGVDGGAIKEFSQRRTEMDEVRRMLEERLGRTISHREEDTIALSTRAGKHAVDPLELRATWMSRADRVGLDIDACFDRADRALAFDALPEAMRDQLFIDLVDPIDGLCARANTFGIGEVMRAITDWSLVNDRDERVKVLVPPDEVERLAARFCATDLVSEISAVPDGGTRIPRSRSEAEPQFATLELLGVQERIVSLFERGIDCGAGTVPEQTLNEAIGNADHLTDEQSGLVTAWLTSGDRVQCAVGHAGAGKTTTMRVAATAWNAAGYRVIGAAIKGEAARQLAVDAGIETDTMAMLLARSRGGARVLDSRTVLIVDEASTIGDRDLLALCELAIETGTALRLIGDTQQHGSVAAGGTYAELVAQHTDRTPQLTTVHRLADTAELHRATLIRTGRIDEAIDELVASGQLVLTDSEHATHAAIVERWYDAHSSGQAHPMVHGRNRERNLLNSLAQQLLVTDGAVDPARFVRRSDGRRLCVGDEVVAKHGDRTIHPPGDRSGWMRNGTKGRIANIRTTGAEPSRDEIDIAIEAGTLTCDRSVFDSDRGGIDLAYALTSYAVQGSTSDLSTSAVTAATSRSELYVDMTRGRFQNQLYGTRPILTSDDASDVHLPTLTPELPAVMRQSLGRRSRRTAFASDPQAIRLALRRDLASMQAARRQGDPNPELSDAIDRALSAIRRIAVHEPPDGLMNVLPRQPRPPHLARRWRRVVGDVAAYIASHPPDFTPDQAGLPGVIGSSPTPGSADEWAAVSAAVRSLAVDLASRDLLDMATEAGDRTLIEHLRNQPEWFSHHLDRLAGRGGLASPDFDRLTTVVREVQQWRADRHLADTTTPDRPLGPPPPDRAGRLRYLQLGRLLAGGPTRSRGRGIT